MAGRIGSNIIAKYFGKLPGQSLADLAAEMKALSDESFEALKTGIESGSLNY